MKRLFDLVLAVTGLILSSPIFILVWLFITCEDRGPLFYRQVRVGLMGKEFRIWKFRSMRVNADKFGPSITSSGDARVTRVGRFLRRTKLDELPQLINVLNGEMSLVGPRPEVPKYVKIYNESQREVLKLQPGITDEASVAFHNEEELLAKADDFEKYYIEYCVPRKIQLNLAYARQRRGLLDDIRVILRTIRAIWL